MAWEPEDRMATIRYVAEVLFALHTSEMVLSDLSPASIAW